MREPPPVPLLHVHPRAGRRVGSTSAPPPEAGSRAAGSRASRRAAAGSGSVGALVVRLRDDDAVDQRAVALPRGPWPRGLWRVTRALGELVRGGAGREDRRRAVQWPVPDRWPVVHAHGAVALRVVWVAAAVRGSGARVVASPLPVEFPPPSPAPEAPADVGSAGGGGTAGGEGTTRRPPGGDVSAGLWRKADLVAVPGRRAREAFVRRGVEHRRLRILRPGDAEAALRLYRRLATAERRSVQRVDWRLAGGS